MEIPSTLMTDQALAALGVSAFSLSQVQRTQLDQDGYLVITCVVGGAEVDRLRSAFDRACEREGIQAGGTRHPTRLHDEDAGFGRFLMHPSVLAAVRRVLGRPFRFGSGAGRDPLPGRGQQGLHIDCVDPGPPAPFHVVTALGLLDDFTPENGATRLVPGSHRLRRAPPKAFADPASRHPEQIVVTAPAGSVLVFNGHLWHGGTLNRSQSHRRVLQYSFLAGEIAPDR
jgi:ectoine hydroxylase-related dioxygenase (phytanoyl-CoA dioxygenase family)